MLIKVKNIKPNPFRKIEKYPIDRAKVEALKTSIKDTSFWDNILARKVNGHYEIAYGHHRWIAIKELGIKLIDIPIRQIDDYLMVKIMAEENLNWTTSPTVVNETVLAAKEFLDGELAKYETWNNVNKSIKVMFASNRQFQEVKKAGVGQTTILKFLGGNWKQWKIQEALKVLDGEKRGIFNRKAIESVGNMDRMRAFSQAVEDYKIPMDVQPVIAKKIKDEEIPSKRVRITVLQNNKKTNGNKNEEILDEIEKLITSIDDQSRSLINKIMQLKNTMNRIGITQLKGVKTWLAASSLKRLINQIQQIRKD